MCKKKQTTKPNTLAKKKKNLTNPLFEDERRNKITFKRRDFLFCKGIQEFQILLC